MHAVELEPPLVDQAAHRVDHAVVLEVPGPAPLGGEHQHRASPVAVADERAAAPEPPTTAPSSPGSRAACTRTSCLFHGLMTIAGRRGPEGAAARLARQDLTVYDQRYQRLRDPPSPTAGERARSQTTRTVRAIHRGCGSRIPARPGIRARRSAEQDERHRGCFLLLDGCPRLPRCWRSRTFPGERDAVMTQYTLFIDGRRPRRRPAAAMIRGPLPGPAVGQRRGRGRGRRGRGGGGRAAGAGRAVGPADRVRAGPADAQARRPDRPGRGPAGRDRDPGHRQAAARDARRSWAASRSGSPTSPGWPTSSKAPRSRSTSRTSSSTPAASRPGWWPQ